MPALNFRDSLQKGQLGESVIANWCKARGNAVNPVYQIEVNTGKGPMFFAPDGSQYAAPDLYIFPANQWIEAKHKTVFTWHRLTGKWTTGIDVNHYEDYQKVQEISKSPVWLLFLHQSEIPDSIDQNYGCPPRCPTGLFGASLSFLVRNENHRHKNGSRHGMVYWSHDKLRLLCELKDLNSRANYRSDGNPLSEIDEDVGLRFRFKKFMRK